MPEYGPGHTASAGELFKAGATLRSTSAGARNVTRSPDDPPQKIASLGQATGDRLAPGVRDKTIEDVKERSKALPARTNACSSSA